MSGLVFAVLIVLPTYSQTAIRFKNITVKQGLSMGTITAFAQDPQGFMWIATAEGLHRFDGVQFKIYKHQENKTNSLSDSYITCLHIENNKLYVGNHSGIIDVLDLKDYTFSSIKISDVKTGFDLPIESIYHYKNKLLVSTLGGGIWYVEKQKAVMLNWQGRSGNERVLYSDNTNTFILDRDSLFTFENEKLVLVNYQPQAAITALAKTAFGYLVGTNAGLFKTDNNFRQINNIALPPKRRRINHITDIIVNQDVIWIGTMGGLIQLKNENITHYYTDQLKAYSLINNQITKLYVDKNNTLWTGTISGISLYDPQLQKFGLLQYFDFNATTYNNNVYFTYEDKSHSIWLGTLTSGVIKLNTTNQIEKVYETIADGSSETKAVRSMLQDSKGRFWIGTRDEGLFLFNPTTEKFKLVASTNNGKIGSNVIRSIYETSDGTIWIGAQNGLYQFDEKINQFIHYKADNNDINNSIYQITQRSNSSDLILASFRGGLQFFNISTHTFKTLKYDEKDSNSLSNNNLMCLTWVNTDTLLIGTYGGGLNIYSFITNTFSHITEDDGLENNAVYGICYQGDGVCWLSTNDGLVRYDFLKKSFANFKPEHYLQSTEFNEGAFLKASNGIMYFGGVDGLNYFNPTAIPYQKKATPIYITDVRASTISANGINYELNYIDSRLEINFVAPNFAHPSGIKYRYKLEGFDNNWIEATENTAVYPQINPGSYTFTVIATDEFGNWESSTQINIKVTPPFWQKWWFLTLCVLVGASLVYFIIRFRTKEIARTYKMQLIDSELYALRSQMNPHFIFNSLNSIQYYILKKEPREAYTYLSKFASLMRKILQNSRLKHISVADEVEWLNLYLELEKLRMDNELDYSVSTEGIEDTSTVSMPTMLIQPFVENSIVHGLLPKQHDRVLNVTIKKVTIDKLVCIIQDNGIGRAASDKVNQMRTSQHKSAGMELTKKRLEILSEGKANYHVEIEDLFDDQKKAIGTKVEITVPIITETK